MEKLVAIFFFIICGFTTVGATVHMHYCMNKYIGASFYHSREKKCANCGMDKSKSKGCCKDEHKFIELKREHQKTGNGYVFSILSNLPVVPAFSFQDQVPASSIIRSYPAIHAPPDKSGQKLYLLDCFFLI